MDPVNFSAHYKCELTRYIVYLRNGRIVDVWAGSWHEDKEGDYNFKETATWKSKFSEGDHQRPVAAFKHDAVAGVVITDAKIVKEWDE